MYTSLELKILCFWPEVGIWVDQYFSVAFSNELGQTLWYSAIKNTAVIWDQEGNIESKSTGSVFS